MAFQYPDIKVIVLIICIEIGSIAAQFDSNYPFQWDSDYLRDSIQRTRSRILPGQNLVFSKGDAFDSSSTNVIGETLERPVLRAGIPQSSAANQPQIVYINNRPTVVAPLRFMSPTTATPDFQRCLGQCPTTSEYNPICATNRELYLNEQKFLCARKCGADIEIVRRGSCAGLFPMNRG